MHCDLQGPAPILSTDHFRFFVTFVDDVLGLYGIIHYIMNLVFFVYQLFEKLFDRQFFAKIKCLQMDGGGEFIGHRLQRYLSEQGILHQIPCPHTPEQNRVDERRHHSIVEASMAQLFHSKVPNDF